MSDKRDIAITCVFLAIDAAVIVAAFWVMHLTGAGA